MHLTRNTCMHAKPFALIDQLFIRYLSINVLVPGVSNKCIQLRRIDEFILLYSFRNFVQYYPENPGSCISGNPELKILTGEHAPD